MFTKLCCALEVTATELRGPTAILERGDRSDAEDESRLGCWGFISADLRSCRADRRANARKSAAVCSGCAVGEDSEPRHSEGGVEAVSRMQLRVRVLCEGPGSAVGACDCFSTAGGGAPASEREAGAGARY